MECGALDFSFLVLLLILSLGLVLRQSAAHMFGFSKAKELPYLPDEVLLNCLARLSRSNYPNLSLVSKRFRSLIASKELYNTRSILGTTESCLYLSLKTNSSSGYKPLFFTLRERTTRTSLNQFPSRFLPRTMHMVSVPTDFTLSPPSPWAEWVTFAIGSDIYMIGGSMIDEPSPNVFVMDSSSHTWRQAPSMLMAHRNPFVAVHDGKIYVTECHSLYSRDEHKVVQVFDPKAQVWEYLPNQENIQMFMEDNGISWKCYCDVDKVRYLYLPAEGYLKWRDRDSDEESSWRTVKGCEHLRNPVKGGETYHPRLMNYDYARLMNFGGKIAVFWIERDKDHLRLPKNEKKKIWYAEITIEKRNGQEIHGKVKYHGVVFTLPKSSPVEQFLVSTV